MLSRNTYSCFCWLFFFCCLFLSYNLFAIKYSTTVDAGTITQYQGPLDNSDASQKLLRIGLPVIAGGGVTPHMTSMTFNLTGNSQIASIELYTTNTTTTFTGAVLLSSVAGPGASVTLTDGGNANADDNAAGTHYYWLVINIIGAITPATKVDASYASGVYVTGPPAFSAGVSDPSGFRLTGRTYKIGSTGAEHYANLDAAANAIRQFDYDGAADIFMELTANYATTAETDSVSFTTHTGPATITFRPESGQTGKISQFAPANLVDFIYFNGVQKITFDGRAGGAGPIQWTIRNTNAPSVNSTVFTFINDASSNTLTYLNIESDLAVADDKGLILFSTTTGTTGNDNNTISFCHIRDWSVAEGGNAALPRNGVFCKGTAGKENSGNAIDNNQFYNICETSDALYNTTSIFLKAGADAWTITNNHFYQTSSYSFSTSTSSFGFILIEIGGGYTINGNFIGGTAVNVGGSPFTVTIGDRVTQGIVFNGAVTAGANTINGNTIANMNLTLSYTGTGTTFAGIAATHNSNFTIGSSGNGNIIGSTGVTGGITLTQNGTQTRGIRAILITGTGINTISYNTISGLNEGGTLAGADTRFISCDGAGTYNILNNNLGSANNNSVVSSNSKLTGIFVNTGGGSIKKNFIQGLTNTAAAGTRAIIGMDIAGTTWDVHNNVIILDNAANSNDMPVYGIQDNNSSTINVYHNTVKISGTGSGTSFTAALYRLLAGTDNVKNNIFQNIRTGGTGGNYSIYAATSAVTYTGDYNYIEVTENTAKTGFWAGTGDRTFPLWQTSAGETNSITGTTTIDASGKAPSGFAGANAGTDLFTGSIVTDDKDGIARDVNPWMGAFESGSCTQPTITLGSNPSVCSGTTSANLTYSATTGSPDQYSINYDATAEGQGFADVTNAALPVSPIVLTVPGAAAAGTYNYTVSVRISSTGCVSSGTAKTITVNPLPTITLGANPSVCSGTTSANLTYSATTGSPDQYSINYDATAEGQGFADVTNAALPASPIVLTVPGAAAAGTYNYTVTVRNSGTGCISSGIAKTVTIISATTFTVTNTLDAGAGSLRQAIINANANCGHDIINFNLGAGGPFTIALSSALPNLTDNAGATIDGWENAANDGTPNTIPVFNTTAATPLNPVYKIILGNTPGTIATGLVLASDNNIIQGLVLQNFGDGGAPGSNDIAITITGNTNQVLGCYIGMDITGTTKGTNTAIGIQISGTNNLIGTGAVAAVNLISGMNGSWFGVYIIGAGATGNIIRGNIIGLQQDGSSIVAGSAQWAGVDIEAPGNTVGGSGGGEGNVISGNSTRGVEMGSDGTGNSIIGNIIGPRADGISYVTSNAQIYGIYIMNSLNIIGGNTLGARNIISANETYGIFIELASSTGNVVKGNYIGIDKNGTTFITGSTQDYGVYFETTSGGSNTIGGSVAGEGNVISGNFNYGISTRSTAAAGNSVIGNIIGPQADGITYLASNVQAYGIYVNLSPNNTIGGNTADARNIISANLTYGVLLLGAGTTGNVIKGNYIGPGSTLATITGSNQDYGVYLITAAANNTIGGSAAGAANQIAFNTVTGCYLISSAATGNLISRNPIYSNTGKPINLNYGGTQANGGKAVPVITTANGTTVSGTSGASDVIEVFKNTTTNCFDAVNYVGTTTAVAGVWSLAVTLLAGDYVLATATDGSNNTSEFSTCVAVSGGYSITTSAIAPTTLCRGGSITVAYTITGPYNAGNVFTAQLSDATGSFAAPTNIGNVTSTTNTSITATIPIGTASGAGYRIRVVSSDPVITGTDNGANLTVPVDGGAGTWTWVGGISINWFDPCNWDKKSLPDASSDVVIPGGTANDPTITGAAANCKTITIDTGNSGILNLNSTAGGVLNVAQ